MLSVSITSDAGNLSAFLVTVQGDLKNPRGLNAALGTRLADELQEHFRNRNREPNRMAAPKTNFWSKLAAATKLEDVTDHGAVVAIEDVRFRIHLFGGTIRPTGGRKSLTLPLIPEARGMSAAQYERATGRKLFRVGAALMERADGAALPAIGARRVTIQRNGRYRQINASAKGGVRGVFALKRSVRIEADPNALPPLPRLLSALQEEANDWIELLTD
jgi:hypothetical protein